MKSIIRSSFYSYRNSAILFLLRQFLLKWQRYFFNIYCPFNWMTSQREKIFFKSSSKNFFGVSSIFLFILFSSFKLSNQTRRRGFLKYGTNDNHRSGEWVDVEANSQHSSFKTSLGVKLDKISPLRDNSSIHFFFSIKPFGMSSTY